MFKYLLYLDPFLSWICVGMDNVNQGKITLSTCSSLCTSHPTVRHSLYSNSEWKTLASDKFERSKDLGQLKIIAFSLATFALSDDSLNFQFHNFCFFLSVSGPLYICLKMIILLATPLIVSMTIVYTYVKFGIQGKWD